MAVAVAARSRPGGGGVHDGMTSGGSGRRRRLGAARTIGERRESDCRSNTLFVYMKEILLPIQHALRLHFLPSPFLQPSFFFFWKCVGVPILGAR